MKIKLVMKNLMLPELRKNKTLLEIELAIIDLMIRTPFKKREKRLKQIKQLVENKINHGK